MRIRVATFNIWRKLSDARTLDDLGDLLATPDLSVAGLQEINWTIRPHHLPPSWSVYQHAATRDSRKDPIVWDTAVWQLEDKGAQLVSDRIDTGRRIWPARWLVWVLLRHRATGQRLLFCNWHLNHDVEQPPGYPENNPGQREHYHSLLRGVQLADELQARYGCPVLIVGDVNVDYGADARVQHPEFPYAVLTGAGFRCCWAGRPEQSTRRKRPHRGRTIDQVWARGGVIFLDVDTPTHWGDWARGDVESDHLPVLVDLELHDVRRDETETDSEVLDVAMSRDELQDIVRETPVTVWRGDDKRTQELHQWAREVEEEQDRQAAATEALHRDVRKLMDHLGVTD